MARILTEDDKKHIYGFLADSYIDLVAKQVIGKVERKVLSAKILEHIEKASTFEEVHGFISSLVVTYPFFKPAAVQVKGEIEKLQESKVIDQLQKYITNFPSKQ